MPIYTLGTWQPVIHPETWIAPNAVVIGRVELQQKVSIWWSATLRGDRDWIRIGENSNIQDGCVLHMHSGDPLLIGRNVTVGHGVILHGCTLEDSVLVGMGAVLLTGTVVGKNSIVAAHALLPEGKTYPERSLIMGSPAKVVRQLSDEEVARLSHSADIYVKNWQRYRDECRVL